MLLILRIYDPYRNWGYLIRQMKKAVKALYLFLFLSTGISVSNAQSVFTEGILVYRGDTIKRLEKSPAAYVVSKVTVYKKQDLLRIEILRVIPSSKRSFQKDIQIRNKQGSYTFLESSDSMMAAASNFAMFMPYEEEKRLQAERILQGYTNSYKVSKLIERIKWLDLPAERVLAKGGANHEEYEMILTTSFDIPVSQSFDYPLGGFSGTPLQFVIKERGWMTKLTATELTPTKNSDTLFEIDAARKVMSFTEMMQELSDFK
jgi:hypothetical protein